MNLHEQFMLEAIKLAEEGAGFTSPNPMVGAIITKQEKGKIKIIGKGYHKKFGHPHAEIEAIRNATEDLQGATMYVNLEPCCHTDKTPPCTKEIIKSGIKEIFVGLKDPNPLVAGKGIIELEKANIRVHTGILEKECQKLNEIFIKWITKHQPFILLKTVCTLDGKIALQKDTKTTLVSEASWQKVHKLRQFYEAILVGIDTVLIDDPKLTCRLNKKQIHHPKRIILDSNLRIPLTAALLKEPGQTIICCTSKADIDKKIKLAKLNNVQVLEISQNSAGKIDLNELIKTLAGKNIGSIMIEGGGTINSAFLNTGLIDKINLIYSPKISGISTAPSVFADQIPNQIKFKDIQTVMCDEDLWWEGYLK
ncbi:riboflavin biosynthesis protein RibD [Candidatus Peregrinibacteria bacterium RIFOXYB2_FULL_32_7]|nr:MAG: riboflavin biosynthesis protein RibD [Candidatus Peregrinibacteria bacterium RIFOXYB2_FULL_32_7]